MKGIIFDVDGTLWDSTREVAVAWNKVLQDEMEGHEILTAEGLQKEFGKPIKLHLFLFHGIIPLNA